MGKDLYFPGANSNASGVAMLLSLAKHFEKIPPKYSIIFIALGGEEAGLLGSQVYCNYPAKPLSKTKFAINLDIVGTGKKGAKVVNGTLIEDKYKMLSDINKSYKYIPEMEPKGEFNRSAQANFYKKGVPSFWIYTLGDPNYYHDLNDTPDNLPLTSFENCYNLMLKFIESFK
jgi:Zn-dependent M28 family amino/carboxypeptidase